MAEKNCHWQVQARSCRGSSSSPTSPSLQIVHITSTLQVLRGRPRIPIASPWIRRIWVKDSEGASADSQEMVDARATIEENTAGMLHAAVRVDGGPSISKIRKKMQHRTRRKG
eukprot:149074-Pleurochrysis_carterae.AAC.2